jgi:hypothetical protein
MNTVSEGVFNHVYDLGEHGVFSDFGGFEFEHAGLVQGGSDNLVALLLFDGDTFARDDLLIHSRVAFNHGAVNRDFFARSHEYGVSDLYVFHWDFLFFAVSDDSGGFGLESHEFPDSLGGSAFGYGI